MATETAVVAPQPAPTPAQTSGGTETGAANSTVSSFAHALARKEIAAMEKAQAVEPAPEKPATEPESAPPATEEAPASSPEAKPAETAPEETPEPETEDKADEVLSNESPKLDPKLQEKIDKRIAKERLATKQAEGQVAQLQAQLEKLSKQPPEEKQVVVPVPANIPLAHVTDEVSLGEVMRQAKAAQREAEELLDRDDIANGITIGDRTYFKADLKAIIRDARIVQEDQVPERYRFLSAQAQAKAKTVEQFPYLLDRTSAEYMEHQAALRANPWLLTQPNADWIVAVQLEGLRAINAKTEAAKKPAATAKPVTKPKPAGDQAIVSTDTSSPRVSAGKPPANTALNGKRGVGAKEFAEFLRQNETIRNHR